MLWKCPQFGGQNHQNLLFLEFLKKQKMAIFKSKNLFDESSKIKILRWQFSCIFRWLCHGILRFFVYALLSLRYLLIKSAIFEHFKKRQKMGVFVWQNSPHRNDFFCFFFYLSSWPDRELRFAPPNFDRGLKTRIFSNDHRAIKNDHYYRNWANGLSHISNYIAIEQ